MSFDMGKTFPIRLLGFGLYWAWLFLVTVSPSPLFGQTSFSDLPSEPFELATRLIFVLVFYAMHKRLETPRGRNALVVIVCIGGPIATCLAHFSPDNTASLVALTFEGLVDASTFVLWLCFFGNMKVGETALYMALSYLIGGLLCIGVQTVGGEPATTIAILLPTASGLMFFFSNKFYAKETDSAELFSSDGEDNEEPIEAPYPYLPRLGVALGCAAFIFSTCSCGLYYGAIRSLFPGATVESLCCLFLGVICFVIMRATKQTEDLCSLYKTVPTLMVLGIVLTSTPSNKVSTAGVALINLGYLVFEITALNDFCIAAKTRHLSLIRTFCTARIAITCGLMSGWIIFLSLRALGVTSPFAVSIGIALTVIALYSSVIFTEKEIYSARNVAETQGKIERREDEWHNDMGISEKQFNAFVIAYRLSTREAEIAKQLIRGRNINYIAEQLFIAPGTVKSHMHNIYTKVNVHNKMELIDAFEEVNRQTP